MRSDYYEQISDEVITLMRRADFKRTLDGSADAMDRSAYLLLKWLDREGAAAIGVIAEAFQLDNSTVSRQVAALETKGWVQRCSDPGDARVSKVEIADAGREAVRAANDQRRNAYAEALSDWQDEELQHFAQLLARLNRAIEKRKKLR